CQPMSLRKITHVRRSTYIRGQPSDELNEEPSLADRSSRMHCYRGLRSASPRARFSRSLLAREMHYRGRAKWRASAAFAGSGRCRTVSPERGRARLSRGSESSTFLRSPRILASIAIPNLKTFPLPHCFSPPERESQQRSEDLSGGMSAQLATGCADLLPQDHKPTV